MIVPIAMAVAVSRRACGMRVLTLCTDAERYVRPPQSWIGQERFQQRCKQHFQDDDGALAASHQRSEGVISYNRRI